MPNDYDAWFREEMMNWFVEMFPIGTPVEMSEKWTKNKWNHRKRGVVVGYQRKAVGPVIVHDGEKTRYSYHWSFIIPRRRPRKGKTK